MRVEIIKSYRIDLTQAEADALRELLTLARRYDAESAHPIHQTLYHSFAIKEVEPLAPSPVNEVESRPSLVERALQLDGPLPPSKGRRKSKVIAPLDE